MYSLLVLAKENLSRGVHSHTARGQFSGQFGSLAAKKKKKKPKASSLNNVEQGKSIEGERIGRDIEIQ